MIFSIQNQKGGVGKSTLSVHIAFELAKTFRVLLIDSDPQGSSRDWAAIRETEPPFSVVGMDRPTIHRDITKFTEDYDHIVIDGPPRVSELARSGILSADLIIIPVQPSPYDVWAAVETVKLIQEASVYKEKLKGVFAVNRKIVNTAIGREVGQSLSEYGLPVLKSQVCQRVAFADSASLGSVVQEVDPTGKAANEIRLLVKEILSYA
jgi:chromosome partitioning protein